MYVSRQRTATHLSRAFTLVELLVVIAIIGILVAILLPAVQSARESARRAQCLNNFKQVGVAMHSYHAARNRFPQGIDMWTTSTPCSIPPGKTLSFIGWGWATQILPYFEETQVFSMFDLTERSDNNYASGNSFKAGASRINSYLCPSDPQGFELVGCCSGVSNGATEAEDLGKTNMAGVADSKSWQCVWKDYDNYPSGWARPDGNGVLFQHSAVNVAKITDGTSHTLMVGEVVGFDAGSNSGYFWVTWDVLDVANGLNLPLRVPPRSLFDETESGFASHHPGGCHFLFSDGSAAMLNESIDQDLLAALATRNGAEVIDGIDR
jgi:prepilin-type N-terminal cleavage/methylation domain-containing protein/prepilin-type processing-associated H-X9-DG protein